jgi:hypothetical protein
MEAGSVESIEFFPVSVHCSEDWGRFAVAARDIRSGTSVYPNDFCATYFSLFFPVVLQALPYALGL